MNTKKEYTSHDFFEDFGELTFAEFLISFRKCEGFNQVEFAKVLGISPANLCDLEKGRKIPSPLRAVNIAKKLELPEALLVQIALQDTLKKDNLDFKIKIAA